MISKTKIVKTDKYIFRLCQRISFSVPNLVSASLKERRRGRKINMSNPARRTCAECDCAV